MLRSGPAPFLAVLLAVGCGAHAADAAWEGGVLGGFVAVDEDLRGPDHRAIEPFLGGQVAWRIGPRWAVFGDLVGSAFDTDTFRRDVVTFTGRAGLELTFPSGRDAEWFVNGAVGYTEVHSDSPKVWSGVASAGVGQWIPVGETTSLRWELRVDGWLAEDGLEDNSVVQPRFLMGWTWGRGRAAADADGDGVRDRIDACPGTEAGAAVDATGCVPAAPPARPAAPSDSPPTGAVAGGTPGVVAKPPADADEDGVPDERDRCEKTLRGFEVDEHGCPRDEDGDGVYDGLGMDKCPGTPAGVPVDRHGCPVDGDGDGVPDASDACPSSPPGAAVDASGCPPQ